MKKLVFVSVLVALSGCATQTFTLKADNNSKEPTKEVMQPFFVAGIGQTQGMNAAEICGGVSKVAKVEAHMSFLDGLLGGITFGIYTPRQAKVYCTN